MRVAWFKPSLPYDQRILMGAAAWLHDVLEDCPHISPDEIVETSGEAVLKLVRELTNPSKGVKAPRAVRKQMDRDHLKHVSWDAKIIKLFDRICNLRDLEQCPDRDFLGLYARESRALLEAIGDIDPWLTKEMLSWINHLEKLANGTAER